MPPISFEKGRLPGVYLITAFFSEDERGYFQKGFERRIFAQSGAAMVLSETFETFSRHGVVRGLHFQHRAPQAKLVRVLQGRIFDVAVDIRKSSPTFGQWEGYELSYDNRLSLYIPPGFAHGFLVLSQKALVGYQCAGDFLPEADTGIRWDDPELGIEWPLEQVEQVILSQRDLELQSFREYREGDAFIL
ncbi:dTDP-4-dehydrorhamnose 3,5-epimerase [Oscillospiraceae bacterium MB08-C2-2]|nr:dTDP-4-dehydrorhamnose 3,5-epimerase [Oscillospiraceae bacterium MB08-C2-2]